MITKSMKKVVSLKLTGVGKEADLAALSPGAASRKDYKYCGVFYMSTSTRLPSGIAFMLVIGFTFTLWFRFMCF